MELPEKGDPRDRRRCDLLHPHHHIGRPSFATDATATKVWDAQYLPFGGVHATTGTPIALRFPGQWFQSESGLHQNWMRDYDPTTGRYIQADPLGLVDGASVYGYALQNPGRYVDFRGLESGVIVWSGAGWGASSFGHMSAFVDDKAYTFGPSCETTCELDRDLYENKNSFRDGNVLNFDFTPAQEKIFQQCLASSGGQYNALKYNCTDPIEDCLNLLGFNVPDMLFPNSSGNMISQILNLGTSTSNLPQSTPVDGTTAPWGNK